MQKTRDGVAQRDGLMLSGLAADTPVSGTRRTTCVYWLCVLVSMPCVYILKIWTYSLRVYFGHTDLDNRKRRSGERFIWMHGACISDT